MAITADYIRYAGDKFILREVGNFNKNLARATRINPSFNLLIPRSVDDFKGWKPGEIARELNRMRTLFSGENLQDTRYSKDSDIKIAKGVKKELTALNKIGNKRAEKIYQQFPDVLGGKLDNIEKNRYAPINLGDGKSAESIRKRAQTIQNRATEKFYQAGFRDTYYHYVEAIKKELDATQAAHIISLLPNAETLYFILQDPIKSMYLSFDFIYDKNIKQSDRYEQIIKALGGQPQTAQDNDSNG